VVNILENLVTPEFVAPTEDDNHEFLLYAQTTWTLKIYAKAAENT